MSAESTMAEVIRAHVPTTASNTFNSPESGSGRYCRCGHYVSALHSAMDDTRSTDSYLDELLAEHVAAKLAEAGYGKLAPLTVYGRPGVLPALTAAAQGALLTASEQMPIETLGGADKAAVWLRARAYALTDEREYFTSDRETIARLVFLDACRHLTREAALDRWAAASAQEGDTYAHAIADQVIERWNAETGK